MSTAESAPGSGEQQDACRTREVLDIVGDKWSLLVVRNLSQGPRRFTELKRAIDGISQRMLTVTLRGLERDGILTRTVRNVTGKSLDADVKPTVTYSDAAIVRMLDKIRKGVDRRAVDATAKLSATGISTTDSRTGLAVETSQPLLVGERYVLEMEQRARSTSLEVQVRWCLPVGSYQTPAGRDVGLFRAGGSFVEVASSGGIWDSVQPDRQFAGA